VEPRHLYQVADVRHDPLVAGLYEPVVVQPVDVLFHGQQFLLQDGKEGAKGLAFVGVPYPIDCREQVV
jgi:hypothetical protein